MSFEKKKSDFMKWSFWRRTGKRFIPLKSTCVTVTEVPLSQAVRLQKLAVESKKQVFVYHRSGPPHFWSSANIDLRPPILESEIAAFSFRVLRTTLQC